MRYFALVVAICIAAPVSAETWITVYGVDDSDIQETLDDSVGEVVRLYTSGGGEFLGTLLTIGENRVELRNSEGLILEIDVDLVTDVKRVDVSRGRNAYYQDAAANKLIIMPVGFGMEAGEFHISDQEIIAVNASYGLNENLSVWAALSIPGLLVNVRGSFEPRDEIGVSVGALGVVTFINITGLVLPYVIASFGTQNNNITVGTGVLAVQGGILNTNSFALGAVIVLGGKRVISNTASIITENWIVAISEHHTKNHEYPFLVGRFSYPGFAVFPMLAFRIAGSRFTWDIGVTMPVVVGADYRSTFVVVEGVYEYTYYFRQYLPGFLLGSPIPIPIIGFTYRIQ